MAHEPAGTPKDYCEVSWEWHTHDYVLGGLFIMFGTDGNVRGDCDGNGVSADFDGHIEFGVNGAAFLKAALPVAPCDDNNEVPHHPVGGPVRVEDVVIQSGVAFEVTADTVDSTGANPCGDGVVDESIHCIDSCYVPFSPGLDGYYVVFVKNGVAGHVYSP